MTSSIGSTDTDRRIELRSQTQDVSNAQPSIPSSPPAPDLAPKPDNDQATAITPKPSPMIVAEARTRSTNDATARLQQQRLKNAEMNVSLNLGTGAQGGGQVGAAANDSGITAANSPNASPSFAQVAADTHVMMRGHRDAAPNGSVATAQEMLNRNGADPALDKDGIFGPLTETGVKDFQEREGLTVDGKLGDKTLGALEKRDDERMTTLVGESKLPDGVKTDLTDRMNAAKTSAERRSLYNLGASPQFTGLDAAQQTEVLKAAGTDPTNTAHVDRVTKLANDAEFKGLDPAVRERALGQITNHRDDPAAAATITNLAGSPGFAALPAAEQGRMLDYVGAKTGFVAPRARAALDGVMADPAFQSATPADQAKKLQDFMKDQPGLPDVLGNPPGQLDATRRPYTLGEPTEVAGHKFRGSNEDALRYDVKVGENTIPVYVPKTQDPKNGNFHSIEEVARSLAALPDVALKNVNGVTVNPVQNPDDAYWAKEYKDPKFRSYMTAGAAGQITVYPTTSPQSGDYLDGSLLHEVGHTVSHNQWGSDETKPAWADYRKAIASDGIDVSKYGQKNPDEDFSESFQLYMGVRGTPQEAEARAMYPARFAIIDRIIQGKGP